MFQPFELFKPEYVQKLINLNKIYLVSQTYTRAFDHFEETKTCLLFTDYDQKGLAEIHLSAVRADKYASIIDLTKPFNGNAEQQLLNQKTSEKIQKADELNQLIDRHSKNTAEINQQKTDNTLATLGAKLARKKEELRDYLIDFATKTTEIALTEQVMADLSSETLPDILNRASDMLAQLTDNAWQEIYLDKEILWVKNVQNQSLRLIDLSTGTRDQLQLALRLAFIQSKNLDFPIFLDDNFLRFDQNRRRNFSNMLAEIAKERQVILLTSDQTLVPETKGTIKL